MANLSEQFSVFQHEAFRLELLDTYVVPEEREIMAHWSAGRRLPPDTDFEAFLEEVRSSVAQGKSHHRLHVVPSRLTPYLRFEIETGYVPLIRAGAEIRLLDSTDLRRVLGGPEENPYDYWLFDERVAFKMKYGSDGAFEGVEEIDSPSELTRLVSMKRALWNAGRPLAELGKRFPEISSILQSVAQVRRQ